MVMLGAACGGERSSGEIDSELGVQVNYLADGIVKSQQAQRRRLATRAWSRCNRQLAGLRAAVTSLENEIGNLYLDEYTGYVASINEQHDKLDPVMLSRPCLVVARFLEDAARLYHSSIEPWALCDAQGADCDIERRDKLLGEGWLLAFDARKRANQALARMRMEPPSGAPAVGAFNYAVPTRPGDVEASVYGEAVRRFCGSKMVIAATEPCNSLRALLQGGIENEELEDLLEAVTQLNQAQNFVP